MEYLEPLRRLARARQEPSRLTGVAADLTALIDADPDDARLHALLGHALDGPETAERAVAAFRRAHELDPANPLWQTYLITLLAETASPEAAIPEIERAARAQGVDLVALRGELRAVGFPDAPVDLVRNGFLHARNFFASFLREEIERVEEAARPGTKRRADARIDRECRERQRDLKRGIDPGRVPPTLRGLIDAAWRYGIGDDVCRARITERATPEQRAALVRSVDSAAAEIDAWLVRFQPAEMPVEAAAFMYLLLAVEEIRSI